MHVIPYQMVRPQKVMSGGLACIYNNTKLYMQARNLRIRVLLFTGQSSEGNGGNELDGRDQLRHAPFTSRPMIAHCALLL